MASGSRIRMRICKKYQLQQSFIDNANNYI